MFEQPENPMDKDIYLITLFEHPNGKETERLVNAESRHAAVKHVMQAVKASAADVARVLGTEGNAGVEEAL